MHAAFIAGDKVFKGYAQLGFGILPFLWLGAMLTTSMTRAAEGISPRAKRIAACASTAASHIAKDFAKNVFRRAAAPEWIATTTAISERIAAAAAKRIATTGKSVKFFLAFGVYLTAVIFSALFLVTNNLVGLIDLGEFLLRLGSLLF